MRTGFARGWQAQAELSVGRLLIALSSLVGIEHLSADELEELRARCEERAKAVAAERTSSRRRRTSRSRDDAGG
jgi:low affinity Fe/Cu permease